ALVPIFVKAHRLENIDDRGERIFFEHERAEHGGFHFEALRGQLAGGRRGHGHASAAHALEGGSGAGRRLLEAVVHTVRHKVGGGRRTE
nr:hypothetical protein [Tanacetum cinerariifolium]